MSKYKTALQSIGIIGILSILIALPSFCFAANTEPVKMDDALWANGKIYVVVLVVFTIFIGIILTLLYLERRIKRLEKETHQ